MSTMNSNFDYLLQYILIGDCCVGKTYISFHYNNGKFLGQNQITIGVESDAQNYAYNNKLYRLQIWSCPGQETFRSIVRAYYKNIVCACIVYDVTNKSSFENVKYWYEDCKKNAPKTTLFVLIGNKIDLTNRRQVSFEEGENCAKKYEMLFFETSTKNGYNIKEIFEKSCQEIAKRIENGIYDLNNDNCGIKVYKKNKNVQSISQKSLFNGFFSWFKTENGEDKINEDKNKIQEKINDIDKKEKNEELNKEIKKLNDEIKNEKEKNKEYNKKIKELNEEIKKEKEKNEELNKKIKELNEEIKKEKDTNLKFKERIKKIEKFENIDLNNPINKIIELMEKLEKKENEIKELKLKSKTLTEENLINIIFISNEEDIYWSISCKNTEKFNSLENLFYEKYPELIEFDIYYECKGSKINTLKTLKENNIQNNNIITLIKKN